jgi:hypothetical protein
MNFDEEHPVLVDLKKRIGGSMAESVSDDEIASEMLRLDPATRAEILLKSEAWLAEPDTAIGMRKRAQLMTFTRALRHIDFDMRKAGR